jgi:hypothetical protein
MDRNNIRLVIWFVGATLLLGLSRIIPHPPNFTPILAVAVFIPFLTNSWKTAVPITLGAMFIGDLYWGLHPYMVWTYVSVLFASVLALYVRLLLGSILAPVLFFIVTNFGVWTSGYYGYTLEGLVTCYIAAIPFFHMTLLGTLFYTGAFFAIHKYTKPLYKTV